MPMVRVWNDNVHPYKEKFREETIEIKPKSFILMEAEQAHLFMCNFTPIKVTADGAADPTSFKMIRIEKMAAPVEVAETDEQTALRCHACNYVGENDTDLEEHLKTHASMQLVDEDAELELKTRPAARK